MKKRYLFSLFVLLSSGTWSQDPEFTQFYSNPLYLNPALAGSNYCGRLALNYRNQWPSLSGTYVTYAAAYDQYVPQISGGLGVLVSHDVQANTITTSNLGLIYSYHLRLGRKWQMLFGAKAAYGQKVLDWDKLNFGDQIDARRGFIYQTGDVQRGGSVGFFDATVGTAVYNKHFNIGFTTHHLNTPNESMIIGDSPLPMRFTGHASANIELGSNSQYAENTTIMPAVIYSYQNGFQQLNIGTYVRYGVFNAGVWYRNRDAFILTIGLQTEKIKIGYSYDLTSSKLNNGVSGGSHELSLGYRFSCKKPVKRFKTISCPSF